MKDIHYAIPEFQRRYVWSKDEQWDPFWEDIRIVAENYLEKIMVSGDKLKAQTQTKPHFLGAVIIQQQPASLQEPLKRDVIDGQQRLTTLQLFLDAFQWVCENDYGAKFKSIAKILSKFVTNDSDIYEGKHIFKLWPSKFDQEIFRHVMSNNLEIDNFRDTRIVQAHEFFQQRVREWLKNGTEAHIEHRINALVGTVTTRLQMAVIELDQQADPHIIFETLNARGTPLAQFELIKNFVMSKAQNSNINIWGNLDDEWWKKEVRQGRLYRPRLDMLFNYWLIMRNGSEVSPPRVFEEFRNQSESKTSNNAHKIHDLMSEIIQDFENYRMYEQTKGGNASKESFYYHMDVMQTGVITPILFLLLRNQTNKHEKSFDALESFLIRRMICRHTTKDYNRMTLEICNKLRQNEPDEFDSILIKFLQNQTADTRKWPSDEDVKEALVSLPLYRLLSKGRLRLVLEGVEHQLRCKSEKIDGGDVPKRLTIEHIMPIGWREDEWPLSNGVDREERNTLINTMGNLTLVTGPLNSSMSNTNWVKKRDALQEYSTLMLNKKWESQLSWTETDIKNRSSKISECVSKRWPGPNSQVWNE